MEKKGRKEAKRWKGKEKRKNVYPPANIGRPALHQMASSEPAIIIGGMQLVRITGCMPAIAFNTKIDKGELNNIWLACLLGIEPLPLIFVTFTHS